MIKNRQNAFHTGKAPTWRSLKYKVQHEITNKKRIFHKSEVVLKRDGRTMCPQELANSSNAYYVSVNVDIPPLDTKTLPAFLPAAKDLPTDQPYEVCKKLLVIKSSKAQGPDNIPCRIAKDFAYGLTESVSIIFNTSLQSGIIPAVGNNPTSFPL